jgi:3-phosphoshikimate 1-carboxyvinyltransferase
MGYNLEKSIDGTLRMTLEEDAFSTRIDALECPDYLPYLILAAAVGNGNTEIYNINDELTDAQSDRIVNVVAELAKLGVRFIETGEGSFKVSGTNAFDGGVKLDCHNDYVIATVMLLATLCCKKSNSVIGYDAVEELYPDFWQMYQSIGGFTEVIVQ